MEEIFNDQVKDLTNSLTEIVNKLGVAKAKMTTVIENAKKYSANIPEERLGSEEDVACLEFIFSLNKSENTLDMSIDFARHTISFLNASLKQIEGK